MNRSVYSRREMLRSTSCGFGYLALASLAAESSFADGKAVNPLAARAPHHPARAKRVIFMFMAGGPTQHETFDYNPELIKSAGKSQTITVNGNTRTGELMGPVYKFERYGQSGLYLSELFPHLGKHADDICLLNGMHTDSAAHPQASIQLHTGSFTFVRPSMGSWILYGLGAENQNLPGFVTINPAGIGGAQNYGAAFLPATYQGTPVNTALGNIPNIKNPSLGVDDQRRQLDFIQQLNRDYMEHVQVDNQVEGLIQSYELAFRMQAAVPETMSMDKEPESIKDLYGINDPATRVFGTQCLLARRLAESGVRFIEISADGWDHHNNLTNRMAVLSKSIDKPMGALLADLKARGMLDDTLVVWGGEFGRSTIAQNNDGRQHNSRGYSMWVAGGGFKAGFRYGSTDVAGDAVEGKIHLHDLHATLLHLVGINHEKLTYRYAGRDFRLTDVYGRVVNEILA